MGFKVHIPPQSAWHDAMEVDEEPEVMVSTVIVY